MSTSTWAKVLLGVSLSASVGCRHVLGLDEAPGASECVRSSDCEQGQICSSYVCVSACGDRCDASVTGAGSDAVAAPPSRDGALDTQIDDVADAGARGSDALDRADVVAVSADAIADGGQMVEESGAVVDDAEAAVIDSASDVGQELLLNVVVSSVLCSGHSYTVDAKVVGGVGPYVWSLTAADPTLSLTPSTDASTTLRFAPTSTASAMGILRVEDASHRVRQRELSLSAEETPVLASATLPQGCEGQPYTGRLAARGGTGSYAFIGAPEGAVNVERGTGIVATTPTKAEPISFKVTVDDGRCVLADTEVILPVEASGSRACPTITPAKMPMPCRDTDYSYSKFNVVGGGELYSWTALSLPPGLRFDEVTHTLRGIVSAPASVTLQARSVEGIVVVKTYDLVPRTACWLGYTASVDSGPKLLHLYDPVRSDDQSHPAAGNGDVVDFAFSPDGKMVAMKVQPRTGPAGLVLLVGPKWAELPVDVGGALTSFAWSPDSRTLGVAFEGAQGGSVGGVEVSPVDSDAGVAPPVRVLSPTQATVSSDLAWVGPDYLAFASEVFPGFQELAYARLHDGGFDPPTLIENVDYAAPVGMRVVRGGVIMSDEVALNFHAVPFNNRFNSYDRGVVDPGGQYVSRLRAGELQLFQVQTPTALRPSQPPWVKAAGCDVLLTWARNRERVACLASARTSDAGLASAKLSVFDLDPSKPSLSPPILVDDGYVYDEGLAAAHVRAFSPSGAWLALTTAKTLYVVAFTGGTARIWGTFGAADTSQSARGSLGEVSFAPDESALLWHRDATLALVDLRKTGVTYSPMISFDPLAAPPPCTEDFVNKPAEWCGAKREPTQLLWSNDSRWAAGRLSSGGLMAWEFSTPAGSVQPHPVCTTACGARFAVQP